jgi:hypothetical protein
VRGFGWLNFLLFAGLPSASSSSDRFDETWSGAGELSIEDWSEEGGVGYNMSSSEGGVGEREAGDVSRELVASERLSQRSMMPGATVGEGVEKRTGSDDYNIGNLSTRTIRVFRARDAHN